MQLLRLKQLIQSHQYEQSESGSIDLTSLTREASASGLGLSESFHGQAPSAASTLDSAARGPSAASLGKTPLTFLGLSEETDPGGTSSADNAPRHMGALMSTAADLGKAVGSLVTAVTTDDDMSDS